MVELRHVSHSYGERSVLRGIDFDSRAGQTEGDQKKAIAAFEEAVRLDPQFTNAWARMARVHANLYFLQIDASEARKEAARAAAETARHLDPAAPETLLANLLSVSHRARLHGRARVVRTNRARDAEQQ